MKKLRFLLFFLLFGSLAQAQQLCYLSPPNTFFYSDLNPTAIKLHWTDVPGAASYEIKVKDLSTNTIVYTGHPGVGVNVASVFTLLPDRPYHATISASSCANGPWPQESDGSTWVNQMDFTTPNIIITDIVIQFQDFDATQVTQGFHYVCLPWINITQYTEPNQLPNIMNMEFNWTSQGVARQSTVQLSAVREYDRKGLVLHQQAWTQLSHGDDPTDRGFLVEVSETQIQLREEGTTNVIATFTATSTPNAAASYYQTLLELSGNVSVEFDPTSTGVAHHNSLPCSSFIGNGRPEAPANKRGEVYAPSLEVMPNPFSGALTVRIGLEQESEVRLALLNAVGQQVQDVWVNKMGGAYGQEIVLETASLTPGVYYLHIQTDRGRTVKKVYKY